MITFEDAPYENPQVITELFPGGLRVPVPRGIEFRYSGEWTPVKVIEALLRQYNQQFGDALFEVTKVEAGRESFHVLPVDWKDAGGQRLKYYSPFLAPVSFSVRSEDSLRSALQRALDSTTSPYESKIDLDGPIPRRAMMVNADFTNKPVVGCIAEIMDNFRMSRGGDRVSWSLRRGPAVPALRKFAVLSVHKPDLDPISGDVVINIEAEKPLATALRLLEKELNCTISYEDNEYVFERDMIIRNGEPEMLSGEILLYSFTRKAEKEEIIRGLVAGFKRYGEFEVARVSGNHFAVYPVKAYDKNGKLRPVDAFSRRRLKQSAGQKTMQETMVSITESLGRETGRPFALKDIPEGLASTISNVQLPEGALMDSLTALLQSVDPQLSWHLLYSVKTKSFGLSIHKGGDPLPGVWQGDAVQRRQASVTGTDRVAP
jgi:hypothetical protein